jgi:superfamily II DNA or RNA helicase
MTRVSIENDLAVVRFERFDIEAYRLFLRCKRLPESQIEYEYEAGHYTVTTPARFAGLLGAEAPVEPPSPLPFSDFLFDDQTAIVRIALEAKRFAVWCDTGLGKTLIQLEFARHVAHITGGRVLIITLGEIVQQTIDEALKFYGESLPIRRIETRVEMRRWCKEGEGHLAITNYEKMNPDAEGQIVSEMRHLSGLILDESSRLKTGGGKQKWALIKSSKGIPYKLSCTATPAPNDMMEFASQASFLERMRDENEIIWTFFRRDPKTQEWTVKRHARAAFFEFMAGWSIYMRDPRKYGWRLGVELPPAPEFFEYPIEMTTEQHEALRTHNTDRSGQVGMFTSENLGIVNRSKLSQIAKGFVYEGKVARRVESLKPGFVVDLIRREVAAGLQVLVWTVFDEETAILAQLLNRTEVMFDALGGSTKKPDRVLILEDFRKGRSQVLISKAGLLGYGMNFQMCGSMIFSGWNDSYEQMYQAVRRAYRFGQERRVRVHVPYVPELEGAVLENVKRKQAQFDEAVSEMEHSYISAMKSLRLTEAA